MIPYPSENTQGQSRSSQMLFKPQKTMRFFEEGTANLGISKVNLKVASHTPLESSSDVIPMDDARRCQV